MKLQQLTNPNLKINQNNTKKSVDKNNVKFTGALDVGAIAGQQFLRWLDTNQAWGANAVDLGCMVIPRTTVDFTRGSDAGFETMRREASGTANDTLVGGYGLLAAALFSLGMNHKYGIKANKILASNDIIDVVGQMRHEATETATESEKVAHIFRSFFGDLKAVDGAASKNITADTQTEINRVLNKEFEAIIDSTKATEKNLTNKEIKNYLKAIITKDTGIETKYVIEHAIPGLEKPKKVEADLETMLNNVYELTKTFVNKKVATEFTAEGLHSNKFLNALKRLNLRTSLLGIGLATGVGLCVQPFNMYLTRKKTGKSGFVGVEGREPDNSPGFKMLKATIAGLAGAGVLASISKSPAEILKKIQFKGFVPTLDQFKMVYGFTIVSRLVSARDKNELRESSIKDSLGFVNWLILGGFVSKLTAMGIEKHSKLGKQGTQFIRHVEEKQGNDILTKVKNGFNKLTKSTLVTRDEILQTDLKGLKDEKGQLLETIKDGKALKYKELVKLAKRYSPDSLKKIKFLNLIQLSGYIYSGVVLGMGIPKLNIAITKHITKKQKAKAEAQKQAQQPTAKAPAQQKVA